jgi:hypothetical protein
MVTKKRKDPFTMGNDAYATFINQCYTAANANALAWGIPAPELAALLAVLTPFNTAWAISKNKTTATTVDRQTTKTARTALTSVGRLFVQKWILLNTLMTDADIKSCGLDPRDKTKTAIGIPQTQPDMYLKPLTSHNIKGSFKQPAGEDGSSKRGKPAGVKAVKVAYFVGANPPLEPRDYNRFVTFTTTEGTIAFSASDAGQPVIIAACWVNEKMEEGDYCEPQTLNVP